MSETIGHDGRVVFENADLFGIDLGTERGLTNGQRLKAGLVVQSAAHPQTGKCYVISDMRFLNLK